MTSTTTNEATARDARRATILAALHRVISIQNRPGRPRSHESLVIGMVTRYGSAERLAQRLWMDGDFVGAEVADRARDRRFAALQRLVYWAGPR